MTAEAGRTVLGLLATDGLDIAVPLASLREVVPCPAELVGVPTLALGLLGVMTLRGHVVPVVDPLLVLGRSHQRRDGQVVVVVSHGGSHLGLLVDEVRGMATVADQGFDELDCAGDAPLFDRSFLHPELGHVVSVLDPARLLGLPGVPVVRDRSEAPSTQRAASGRALPLTLVRCGGYTLALDVTHVRATVPAPAPSRSALDSPVCLGVTPVAGVDVPVVDLPALLGLPPLGQAGLGCGLVVALEHGEVVLGVGELIGLRDVAEEDLLLLPAGASPAPGLLPRVADLPGLGACLVLDPAALTADPALVSLSKVGVPSVASVPGQRTDPDGGPAARTDEPLRGVPHLAYRAGVDLATDLVQVAEVLAFPTDLVPSSTVPGVLGFVLHRGVAVTVLCLATALERQVAPYTGSSRLLLVEVDGEQVAFAVGLLHAIAPLVRSDPAQGSPGSVLHGCPLVELAGQERLLPSLDLVALARTLLGQPTSTQSSVLETAFFQPA